MNLFFVAAFLIMFSATFLQWVAALLFLFSVNLLLWFLTYSELHSKSKFTYLVKMSHAMGATIVGLAMGMLFAISGHVLPSPVIGPLWVRCAFICFIWFLISALLGMLLSERVSARSKNSTGPKAR